jgi:hypothetical protein
MSDSPECVEGDSVLKTPSTPALTTDRAPNAPLLGLLKPGIWPKPARCRLYQQAGEFSEVQLATIRHQGSCVPS